MKPAHLLHIDLPHTTKPWYRRWQWQVRRIWRRVIHLDDTPHRIAIGLTVGILAGWMPLVGQMTLAIGLALVVRGNLVAAALATWFSNPVTMLPCLWLVYTAGSLALGRSPGIGWAELTTLTNQLASMPWRQALGHFTVTLFWEFFLPMSLGGLVMGGLTGVPVYVVARRLVSRYHTHRAARRLAWR